MTKGTTLPDDWEPSEADVNYGIDKLGMTLSQILAKAEDMKLWARANRHRQVARKSDWSLAFKGWLRREKDKADLWTSNKPRKPQQADCYYGPYPEPPVWPDRSNRPTYKELNEKYGDGQGGWGIDAARPDKRKAFASAEELKKMAGDDWNKLPDARLPRNWK